MNIGIVIHKLRCISGLSQEDLCRGLCSLSTLSRIENDKHRFDRLLCDALIQRLGRSPDKYVYLMGMEEHRIYEIRKEIMAVYEDGDDGHTLMKLDELSRMIHGDDTINRQFVGKMGILLFGQKATSKDEAVNGLITVLRITVPDFKIGKLHCYLMSLEELRIYFLIGVCYMDFHDINKSIGVLKEILVYLDVRYIEEEERIKLYPQVAHQLVMQYGELGQYKKMLGVCDLAIGLLVKNIYIHFLAEFMILKAEAMKELQKRCTSERKMKQYAGYKKVEGQAECLEGIIREYSIEGGGKERQYTKESKQNRVKCIYLIHEVVKRQREMKNITQAKLSEGICSTVHMSRIESGQKVPNMKNYQMIMERLSQCKERYQSCISTDDYEVLNKHREVVLYISKSQYDKAEEVFRKMLPYIPSDITQNEQYKIMMGAIIDKGLRKISDKGQLLDLFEQAIRCTITSYKRGKTDFVKVALSENEITLISNIANTYKEMDFDGTHVTQGENLKYATDLLGEMLKSYRELKVGIKYNEGSYIFLLSQYAGYLGLSGSYHEAIAVHKEVLLLNIDYGYGDYICESLYGISWNLLRLGEENKEACKRLCRQAYSVCEIMKMYYRRNWLKDKFFEVYGEIITIWL